METSLAIIELLVDPDSISYPLNRTTKVLHLDPLDETKLFVVAKTFLGVDDIPQELWEVVVSKSQGNPELCEYVF